MASATPTPTQTPAPLPPVFKAVIVPLQAFFRLEAASGILLALCALVAMLWANSPWAASYTAIFDAPLGLRAGGYDFRFTFRELINDGLMTLFFFLVGLEIKRELGVGELRTFKRALLPLIAALGGMLLPAGLYLLFNAGTPAARGWAIPMATDIAFSIGCLALLRGRVGHPLVVFLTALAIFDDIGGILVIALFYGTGLHAAWLLAALLLVGLLFAFNRLYVRNGVAYAVAGAALWYCMHHGGVHATIAGVVLGMMVPALPTRKGREVLHELRDYLDASLREAQDESVRSEQILYVEERLEDVEPPLNRFLHLWHGYVAFGIVPLFALANSGISLDGMGLQELFAPLSLGIICGLFVGKTVGISLFTWVAIRTRLSPVPSGATGRQVFGVAMVAGIGFTVALFVAGLAFADEPLLLREAKLGILLGSLLSALLGYALLRFVPAPRRA
jgi:NhaA family Na+:H+ antiporter